jgi:hypothetical protein
VSETPDSSYVTSYSLECSGTVTDQSAKESGGQFTTCTITTNYRSVVAGPISPTTTPTSTTPGTTSTGPTATTPGNQTATNSTMQTFYVYVHVNNKGGGTKTVKDLTVSFPSIFKGEPCGITGRSGSFKVSPDTFPGSETGTPVKVSGAADFCASPGTNLISVTAINYSTQPR